MLWNNKIKKKNTGVQRWNFYLLRRRFRSCRSFGRIIVTDVIEIVFHSVKGVGRSLASLLRSIRREFLYIIVVNSFSDVFDNSSLDHLRGKKFVYYQQTEKKIVELSLPPQQKMRLFVFFKSDDTWYAGSNVNSSFNNDPVIQQIGETFANHFTRIDQRVRIICYSSLSWFVARSYCQMYIKLNVASSSVSDSSLKKKTILKPEVSLQKHNSLSQYVHSRR